MGMQFYKHYLAPRDGPGLPADEILRFGFGFSYTPFLDNTYAFNYPSVPITITRPKRRRLSSMQIEGDLPFRPGGQP
jgi:hypothetical protein